MWKMKLLDEKQWKLLWNAIQMRSGQKLQAALMAHVITGYVVGLAFLNVSVACHVLYCGSLALI